ncbi:MAG: cell division protein ZapA [Desulfuromonas sp.]|nr:cell division protein ZapA [Desulfuromonas thiophila]MDD3801784.1 cell division protein ZapA [Desulfuromonas thiophila]
MKHRVEVEIRGQRYSIRSSRCDDDIRRVAQFVDQRVAEVLQAGATVDSLQATVLAFMNVAGQYLDLQQQNQMAEDLQQRLDLLERKLSAALV